MFCSYKLKEKSEIVEKSAYFENFDYRLKEVVKNKTINYLQ